MSPAFSLDTPALEQRQPGRRRRFDLGGFHHSDFLTARHDTDDQ
jgi:hypothetical protein